VYTTSNSSAAPELVASGLLLELDLVLGQFLFQFGSLPRVLLEFLLDRFDFPLELLGFFTVTFFTIA